MCHYPQEFPNFVTDLAPFRLCPAHVKSQPRNPRLRMGYIQSNDRRRTTRARCQLPSRPLHDVAKRSGSSYGPVT